MWCALLAQAIVEYLQQIYVSSPHRKWYEFVCICLSVCEPLRYGSILFLCLGLYLNKACGTKGIYPRSNTFNIICTHKVHFEVIAVGKGCGRCMFWNAAYVYFKAVKPIVSVFIRFPDITLPQLKATNTFPTHILMGINMFVPILKLPRCLNFIDL